MCLRCCVHVLAVWWHRKPRELGLLAAILKGVVTAFVFTRCSEIQTHSTKRYQKVNNQVYHDDMQGSTVLNLQSPGQTHLHPRWARQAWQ